MFAVDIIDSFIAMCTHSNWSYAKVGNLLDKAHFKVRDYFYFSNEVVFVS